MLYHVSAACYMKNRDRSRWDLRLDGGWHLLAGLATTRVLNCMGASAELHFEVMPIATQYWFPILHLSATPSTPDYGQGSKATRTTSGGPLDRGKLSFGKHEHFPHSVQWASRPTQVHGGARGC